MSSELSPPVAQILRGEHTPDPASVAQLPPDDSAQLAAIARGESRAALRVKALSCFTGTAEGGELFRAALEDRDADDTVRAAGATLLSRTDGTAETDLLAALPDEPSAVVRHKIVAGLARIGAEQAVPALTDMLDDAPADLRDHAAFARSVVAYRLGRTGFELPGVRPEDVLPAPAPPQPAEVGQADPAPVGTASKVAADVASDNYGLPLDSSPVTTVRCGARTYAVIVNADVFAPYSRLERPAVAGLVASRAPVDGSYHTSMIVLCHPDGASGLHIAVHHPSGPARYVGSGKRSETGIEFELAAVRGPGAVETTITGVCGRDGFTEFAFTTGRALPAKAPTPVEE
ncbi:HEAT repeat domain-containing protein [Streptomyces afghaniensis]|uniref:HEAT repeat domain-containing protein n=1 Tax=Streptomyces afghaniensis TaxID=66865 RepID=UPI0033B2EF4E